MTNVTPSEARSYEVAVPDGAIVGRVEGSGQPLVLVSTLSGIWVGQRRDLKSSYRVISYDMRGFGLSKSHTGYPSAAEHADDLARFLDRLDIQRAIVVGLSHGGLVAQQFAIRHAERLSGLVLVATFARAVGSTKLLLEMLCQFLDEDDLESFWKVLKYFMISERKWKAIMGREKAMRRLMFNQYTPASMRSIYHEALTHDVTQALASLRSPTLVIGGAEDALFPVSLTRALADLIPNAAYTMLDTAHVPPVEDPEGFNALVRSFSNGLHGAA